MVGYLLLDAWIGNTDRHDENWGWIVKADQPKRLAPTFDHSSSLGRNESDERRVLRLKAKHPQHSVEGYALRALSGMHGPDGKKMHTIDAFMRAAELRPAAARVWRERLDALTPSLWETELSRVPEDWITPVCQGVRDRHTRCSAQEASLAIGWTMTTVYLAWRDPGRRWFPVGRLTRDDSGRYQFVYTHGAAEAHEQAGFAPLVSFPDWQETYESGELFPLFANRLLSERRPEFPLFQDWLNLPRDQKDPLVLLARSNGIRETDTFQVFAHPVPDDEGRYHVHCFIHGLRHRDPDAINRAESLVIGEPLWIEPDPENPADALAIKTLTVDERPQHIGFLPRYLTSDVRRIGIDQVHASVERVNPRPTPAQFRVLVRLLAAWPPGFQPYSDPSFAPLSKQAGAHPEA